MNLWDALSEQSTHRLWLIGGLIVLGLGMLVGEPGIASIGLAALITAVLALTVPSIAIQLIVWSILSLALAVVLRGLVSNQPKPSQWQTEAEVTMMIPEGRVGEVAYEGTLWKAKCDIANLQVAEGELVYVVGRQGNTLIVMPTRLMNSPDLS
jgi:membrane protein implicated in regulation of membrane protease activity